MIQFTCGLFHWREKWSYSSDFIGLYVEYGAFEERTLITRDRIEKEKPMAKQLCDIKLMN